MKRIIALLMCLCIVLSFASCGEKSEQDTTTIEVGFGRADITPDQSVPIGGHFGSHRSVGVADPLYASCVAISDNAGTTVVLFHLDLLGTAFTKLPFIRKAVAEAIGVDKDNIMMCATHNHSGPQTGSTDPVIERYIEAMEPKLVAAAEQAMADREPAQLYTSTTRLKNMNFVRHYLMSDGSVAGDNFGDFDNNTIVKHVEEVDDEMQLIRFARDDGKDVVLVNWQAHPLRIGVSDALLSSDIVGSMRTTLEEQLDCHMLYFTGASGNVDLSSRINSENITADYWEQGEFMAYEAELAMDSMKKEELGKLQCVHRDVEVMAKGKPADFPICGITFGDVAFVSAPYEMFNGSGEYIKENSPFDITFISTVSNGGKGYIPTEETFEYGGYEVSRCNYDKGTAEKLAEGYVALLKELYDGRK